MRLHRKAFAHRKLFHMGTFDTEAFTDRSFSQRSSLHRVSCTHRMATECAKYFPVLFCTSQYYLVLQACTKHVTVLLRTSKLVQSTSQYYFVLQSLHKARPSTTLYFKACTKYFPSTTLYYKTCTKYFPVLLCTTKLVQNTCQSYICISIILFP